MGNPEASRPQTSQAGQAISSQALAQPSLASSTEKRLTATASTFSLVTTLMRSTTSPVISAELKTSLLDSVSTTVKKTGGTGQYSSAVVTTPSTKDTGATSRLVLSRSPALPSAVRYPTTPKHHSPGSSRRLNNQTPRPSSTRSAASSRSSESTFSVALAGLLNGKHPHQISTLRFSHSLPLSAELKPGLALSGTSSSCWKAPASSENGAMRAVSQVPATPTETTGIGMPNSSMTEVSLSREKSALSHGTSPSPHHPPPALSPSATPVTVVPPGSRQGAPMVTGRTGTPIPQPQSQQILSTPDESVLP